jgi:hypothetical protein
MGINMRIRFGLVMLSVSILFAGSLSGCQTYDNYLAYFSKNPIITHRSPLVAIPAFIGTTTGVIAGFPLGIPPYILVKIIAGPKKRPDETAKEFEKRWNEYNKDPNNTPNWIFAPSFILGFTGQQALGIPCWMLFGWWWPASEYSCLFGNVKKREPPCSPPVNGG